MNSREPASELLAATGETPVVCACSGCEAAGLVETYRWSPVAQCRECKREVGESHLKICEALLRDALHGHGEMVRMTAPDVLRGIQGLYSGDGWMVFPEQRHSTGFRMGYDSGGSNGKLDWRAHAGMSIGQWMLSFTVFGAAAVAILLALVAALAVALSELEHCRHKRDARHADRYAAARK
jgi:hypothetical protein